MLCQQAAFCQAQLQSSSRFARLHCSELTSLNTQPATCNTIRKRFLIEYDSILRCMVMYSSFMSFPTEFSDQTLRHPLAPSLEDVRVLDFVAVFSASWHPLLYVGLHALPRLPQPQSRKRLDLGLIPTLPQDRFAKNKIAWTCGSITLPTSPLAWMRAESRARIRFDRQL